MRESMIAYAMVALLSAQVGARADVVTDWNAVALGAIRADRTAPPIASRALAIVHVAIFDAVNGIARTHQAYHVQPAAPDRASVEASVASAGHDVLVALFPAQQANLDAALEVSLGAVGDGAAKEDGVAWGKSVAAAILALRADDGSADAVDYTPGTRPGDWRPTPPAFAPSLLPQWPDVTPFAMDSGSQFRGAGPPALNSAEYAAGLAEVAELGRTDSSTRTADQSDVARFWVNGPGTATPIGHWNTIAQIVAGQEGNTVEENARLFALLNIAGADAAIISWDNKYAFNHWRPVTACQLADTDGNDSTQADVDWASLIPTPPFPEYTSGHSTFSGAASKVLELFYRRDDLAFTVGSDGVPGVERAYARFSEAADESGRSRIYGGIHFEYSNVDGLSSGRALGEHVFKNFLGPAAAPGGQGPLVRLCGALGVGNIALMAGLLLTMRLYVPRRQVRQLQVSSG